MDDDDPAAKSKTEKKSKGMNSRKHRFNGEEDDDDEAEEVEQCDVEVWETLSKSFRAIRTGYNHQSRIHDNLVNNVDLIIRLINGNISNVLSIYSDLSLNFSTILQQRRAIMPAKSDDEKRRSSGPES